MGTGGQVEPLKEIEARATFLEMYDRMFSVTYVENAKDSGIRDQFRKLLPWLM